MSERAKTERPSERMLCPNCPADFPRPFSSHSIRCRRCGTEFVAPDDARTPRADEDEAWADLTVDETGAKPVLDTIDAHFPTIALCFNLAAVSLWIVGLVSFEVAVVTILLSTSALVADRR